MKDEPAVSSPYGTPAHLVLVIMPKGEAKASHQQHTCNTTKFLLVMFAKRWITDQTTADCVQTQQNAPEGEKGASSEQYMRKGSVVGAHDGCMKLNELVMSSTHANPADLVLMTSARR